MTRIAISEGLKGPEDREKGRAWPAETCGSASSTVCRRSNGILEAVMERASRIDRVDCATLRGDDGDGRRERRRAESG